MVVIKRNWLIIIEFLLGICFIILDLILKIDFNFLSNVNSVLYETLIVVAGFWVTLYLLFLELYKDRYPLKYLESKYLIALKQNIKYIAFCALYGLIVMIMDNTFLESIYYTIISLCTIVAIGIYVYDASKTIMVTNFVQDFCDSLSKRFQNNESTMDKSALDDLNRVFEECIMKEEFSVAQKISKCSGDVFRDYMKKSIEFIEKGTEPEKVEETFKRIARFGKKQLLKCKEIESSLLKEDIAFQQYKNLKFCIDTRQFEYFKIYINELVDLTSQSQRNRDDELVEITFELYKEILDDLFENNMSEWVEYILERVYTVTRANSYFFTNECVKDFVNLITFGLVKGKEISNYESMFKMFEEITVKLSDIHNGFSPNIIYYMVLFRTLKEGKPSNMSTRCQNTQHFCWA